MRKRLHPNARPGNANAAKPDKEKRVVLPGQRVAPATLVKLERLAAQHGGIGRAIDYAVSAVR